MFIPFNTGSRVRALRDTVLEMASMNTCSTKWPPVLVNEDNYESWKNDLLIWCDISELDKTKQAQTVHLSMPLESRARAATSEVPRSDLKKENGVEIILKKLDEIFLPDKGRRQFSAFKSLYNLRRRDNVPVSSFVNDFEHAYFKFKEQDMKLPDSVMAFMLLASCSLSDEDSRLVMSAITEVTYSSMKSALRRIFDNEVKAAPDVPLVGIKIEPTLYSNDNAGANIVNSKNSPGIDSSSINGDTTASNVYYARGQQQRGRFFRGRGRGRGRGGRQSFTGANAVPLGTQSGPSRRMNPLDTDGNVSRCVICDSRLHWVRDCPHSFENMKSNGGNEEDSSENVHLSLFMGLTGAEEKTEKLSVLMNESAGCAVLDTGCINTVCGSSWLEHYMDSLTDADRAQVLEEPSQKSFTFGDGASVKSIKRVKFPCVLGGTEGTIVTDVVPCNLPLLLSKTSMKRGKMSLFFETDSVAISGKKVALQCTTSGHYILPLFR